MIFSVCIHFPVNAITSLFTDRKKPIVYIGAHFLYRSSVCGHPHWIFDFTIVTGEQVSL